MRHITVPDHHKQGASRPRGRETTQAGHSRHPEVKNGDKVSSIHGMTRGEDGAARAV